jgi:hypothetical protein
VITYTAASSPTCSNSATFTIAVYNRQEFDVCAPDDGKVYEVINSELTQLFKLYDPQDPTPSNEVYTISNHRVLVEIFYVNGQLANLLAAMADEILGFELDEDMSDYVDEFVLGGLIPIASLETLNHLNDLKGTYMIRFAQNLGASSLVPAQRHFQPPYERESNGTSAGRTRRRQPRLSIATERCQTLLQP